MAKTKTQLISELEDARRQIQNLKSLLKPLEGKTEESAGVPRTGSSDKLNENKTTGTILSEDNGEKYRYLFENMTQGVFYQKADGSLVDCNSALLDMWGLTRDQFLGRTSMHPDWRVIDEKGKDIPGENHPSMVALKTGKPVWNAVTGVYNTQKRKYKWAILNATPQFMEGDEKPYQVMVTIHDITDRKAAEVSLKESEEQLRAITENARDGIIMMRPDGTISFWNKSSEHIFGYNTAEALGKNLLSLLSPEHLLEMNQSAFEKIFGITEHSGPADKSLELKGKRKDGTEIHIELSLTTIQKPDGWHAVAIVRDVTERRQMINELLSSKRLLTDMGQIARVGGWEIDTATMKQNWTEGTYAIHDQEEENYNPNSDNELSRFLPGSREIIEKAFKEALEDGKSYDLEAEMITIRGNRKWVRAVCKPDTKNGKVIALKGTLQDITQQKATEEALRIYQEDLENSQKIAHVGSWRLDVKTNQVVWTDELYKIYGFDPTLPPPPFTEHKKLFTPKSWEKLSTALENTRNTGIPYTLELETVLEDKSTGWMWVHGEVILDANGTTIGLRGAAQDITQRKRAEEKIRESEQRFRQIYEHSAVGLAQVSLDFHIQTANPAYCNMLGYTEEELVGKHLSEITHPEIVEENLHKQNLLTKGEIDHYRMEKQFIHKNGRTLHGIIDAIILRDQQGKPSYTLGSVLDISEMKQTENALRESESKLASAVSIAKLGYWELDISSRIFTFTDSFYILFRTTLQEMGGYQMSLEEYISRFVHPDDAHMIKEEMQKSIETTDPDFSRYVEHRIIYSDGTQGFIGVKYFIEKNTSGQTVRVYGAHQDITDRKLAEIETSRLEEQLQQAMKMEAVGRLAGGVAHDFNNLLTGIMGNISLALLDLEPHVPLVDTLSEINKAADSAATLTRQLLAFSRKQIIEPKVVNLNEIISNLHKMLVRLIGEDIELETIPGKELGSVKVDRGQFEQILVNLAVNARDAMPNGGKLVIETANVELDDEYCSSHPQNYPGVFTMLAVSDTGHGISPEARKHLFEPFFTTKPKGFGTGLGLATTYGAVKQSNGFIEVYSEEGQGTTFKIYLPQVDGLALPAGNAGVQLEMPMGKETVLLVEDEEIVRNFAIRVLKRLGYNVLPAPDGESALIIAKEYVDRIDLLMTDVVMPGMNGRQLADRLVKIHPNVKILFASGYTENIIVHHGVVDEDLNFIGKPYSPQTLAKKLRVVLGE
ncbi:MAG: PAS domain S-box protein [Deltaproteobacteria bacterium]|nr:PAS domain S-box protein [Deltaproteobacteria bacterium]